MSVLNLKVVNAVTDLGKTKRGGSSSRFIQCDDGKEYVVKFTTIQGPKLYKLLLRITAPNATTVYNGIIDVEGY